MPVNAPGMLEADRAIAVLAADGPVDPAIERRVEAAVARLAAVDTRLATMIELSLRPEGSVAGEALGGPDAGGTGVAQEADLRKARILLYDAMLDNGGPLPHTGPGR